ncbi:MAG: polysaccharide deacetylase family protein [Rhodospirillales bacterium]
MAGWDDLDRELDVWRDQGRTATLWWRDDDATRVTPALERLLAISGATGTPVALAVIPRDADADLRDRLRRHPSAAVLQHGWSHENHAPDGCRQEEHGPHRPREVMLAELAEGWRRIGEFDCGLPVLVAPWNRIDEALLPALPGIGLTGVSTLGPRDAGEPVAGLRRTNVHVDIVDWDGSRGFVGEEAALDQFVRHLARRRRGEADADEPTGMMTHHLFHDEGCWWFIGALLARTARHPAVRWLDAGEAFWP